MGQKTLIKFVRKTGGKSKSKAGKKYRYRHSDETRRKISEARKGYKMPIAHRAALSEAAKKRKIHGHTGRKHSEESKRKMSAALTGHAPNSTSFKKGNIPWNKGAKMPEEAIRKMSKKLKGSTPWNKGKKNCFTEEAIRKMSDSHKGHVHTNEQKLKISLALSGDKAPHWKGGIAVGEYCDAWADKEFKRDIKERDGYKCQNPLCYGESNNLCIHHIDYDKKNCNPSNLITICFSCNGRANHNRDFWEEFYTKRAGTWGKRH